MKVLPSEVVKWARSLRTVSIFAGGNLVVAVIGAVGGLIQARWIGPETLGEFGKFGILAVYFNVGVVVVGDGLTRQYPYLLGRGRTEEALQVAACAKWWYLLLGWVFSAVFVALALRSLAAADLRSAVGWGAQVPVVVTAFYGRYLGTMYRTSSDFERLSYNSVASKVVDFLALALVRIWGYWGLVLRSVLGNAVGLVLNRRFSPVKVKAKLDGRVLRELARISLPLSIPGYIGSSLLTASLSVIVLRCCGEHGLGVYSMAFTFQAMAMIPLTAIQQVFATKVTYKLGETGDVRACLRYSRVPTLMSFGAAALLAAALCMAISPFVRILLPRYMEAIPVIRVLAAQLPLTAAGLPLIIVSTSLWYKELVALTLVRVLVPLGAVVVAPKTVTGISWCVVIGVGAHMIAGNWLLEWKCRRAVPAPAYSGTGQAGPVPETDGGSAVKVGPA